MNFITPILIVCQAIGALIGAYTVIHGELAYIRATRDGCIDEAERAHLVHIGRGLRYGMLLLLLASLGTVIVSYTSHAPIQPAVTVSYWIFMLLALVVTMVSWALARRHMSFLLGSAVVFTAWWFLVYLAIGLLPSLSFGSAVALFVIFAGIFYALLKYVRRFSLPKT
jgi:hypothetical protein